LEAKSVTWVVVGAWLLGAGDFGPGGGCEDFDLHSAVGFWIVFQVFLAGTLGCRT